MTSSGVPIQDAVPEVFVIPTDAPESDGTFEWNSTTLIAVTVSAGGEEGLGYTYGHRSGALVITETLAPVIRGHDAMAVDACWRAMVHQVRNVGLQGIAATAISAVDSALWDLKARLLGVPLVTLLGSVRDAVPIYGSGGFTSYPEWRLRDQLGTWIEQGIRSVKMKVGREPTADPHRVTAAREAIGPDAELFVDANGGYTRKQALGLASAFRDSGVSWFEEPVSSDDLDGLRLLRDHAPGGMEIAAGEYGFDVWYFRRMLEAGAVDVLQADATRCCGITGFLHAAALCETAMVPLSAHTAPSLHVHLGCALNRMRHLEWFHDHVRIEQMLFAGAPVPDHGQLRPDRSRPGMGLELKRADAARYAA
ncbi:MAG TPA: enolase C-terminal domain-like protein [Gemmatimonadales bacterium]|nr:enolase C-terminal domain-like protein [Gemmatimonadales bacterium]